MTRWALRHLDGDAVLGDELVIGRSSSCDLSIDDGAASRRHAVVRLVDGAVTVEDLGSRNGTQVDGKLIGSVMALRAGSQITIGATTLVLVDLDARGRERTTTPPTGILAATAGPPAPSPRLGSPTIGTGLAVPDLALLDRARDALSRGALDECAGATAVVIRRQINNGTRAHADVIQAVSTVLIELARRSGDRGWLEGLFQVHAAADRLLEPGIVDAIAALPSGGPMRGLGPYLLKIRDRTTPLAPHQEQLLARIESLGG